VSGPKELAAPFGGAVRSSVVTRVPLFTSVLPGNGTSSFSLIFPFACRLSLVVVSASVHVLEEELFTESLLGGGGFAMGATRCALLGTAVPEVESFPPFAVLVLGAIDHIRVYYGYSVVVE
jgi:hypothetical protein